MLINEERIYSLAHLICDGIWKDDLLDFEKEDIVLRNVRKFLINYFSKDEKLNVIVKNKINSLSKVVHEGSQEWDILYKKYYSEELKKIL